MATLQNRVNSFHKASDLWHWGVKYQIHGDPVILARMKVLTEREGARFEGDQEHPIQGYMSLYIGKIPFDSMHNFHSPYISKSISYYGKQSWFLVFYAT